MRLNNGDVLFAWPLSRHLLTAGYYYNNNGKYNKLHQAIDMRCTWGGTTSQPVYAAEDGTVNWVQNWDGHTKNGSQSYGTACKIKHAPYKGKTLETRYAHLSRLTVNNGQHVNEGQIIGYTGNTGNSNGAHLHFEVILNGNRMNPLVWLDEDFEAASGFKPYTYGAGEHAVKRPANAIPQGYTITIGKISKGDFEAVENAVMPIIRQRSLSPYYHTKKE